MAPIVLGEDIGNPLSYSDFPTLFGGIATELGKVIAILGGIMIIVAGIMYLTSAGSSERIGTAKKALMYAIAGIIVGLVALVVTDIIKSTITGTDLTTIIQAIATEIATFITPLAVTMMIVSGGFYLTAGGNPERMKVARTAFIFTVVGLIIGLLSSVMVDLIKNTLGI